MSVLARWMVALLLVMGAVACGGDGGGNDGASEDVPGEIDTAAPEQESAGGTEEGDNGGGGAVAVELPGLPIGGGSTVVSETLQCADVSWSGPPDLPEGWGVSVTGVAFDPSSDFAVSDEGCPTDTPSCLDSGVQVTSSGGCHVAVTWTAANTDGGEMSFTSGVVTCPPEAAEECQGFKDQVESDGPQSIPLEPAPTTEGEGTTDGGGTDGTEGTDSSESGESESPEAPGSEESGETGSTDDGGG